MLVNYTAVDSASLNVDSLCSGMQENGERLGAMVNRLAQLFAGDAAEVANPLLADCRMHLGTYTDNLRQVRHLISKTSGSEGFMKETDSAQGARFLALG